MIDVLILVNAKYSSRAPKSPSFKDRFGEIIVLWLPQESASNSYTLPVQLTKVHQNYNLVSETNEILYCFL